MKQQWVLTTTIAVIVIASHSVSAGAQESAAATDTQSSAAQCKALERADFTGIPDAPTQLIQAKFVEAAQDMPAYCDVKGYVEPTMVFELRLPATVWNGKFFEVGCGGACGYLAGLPSCPLKRGYACITSDMGHTSSTMYSDGLWAYNNLQTQIDFGYRGPHVTAVAGKAITEYYYSKAPKYSYFQGCSTGGRQALIEAERFPWDFNGIIGGAPWIDDSDSAMNIVWAIRALTGNDGKLILGKAELQLVHDAALAECDMDDGVKDGLISDPHNCKFDPARLICKEGQTTACLSEAQADAVKKIYDGPRNSQGKRLFTRGAAPGSEMGWVDDASYHQNYVQSDGTFTHIGMWTLEYFRYMVLPGRGAGWNLTDYDFDRDPQRFASGIQESLLSVANPNLRKFKEAGGKLIVNHGWADQSVPTEKTIDFYDMVTRTMGGRAATEDFFRLFLVPGMKHCSGGDGAYAIDYLTYMEAWVERGQAPDVMIGARVDEKAWNGWFQAHSAFPFPLDPAMPVQFTRPIYPYPLYGKYKGKGNPNDAANFVPVAAPK